MPGSCKLAFRMKTKEANFSCFRISICGNNFFPAFVITAIKQGVLENEPVILILLTQFNQIKDLFYSQNYCPFWFIFSDAVLILDIQCWVPGWLQRRARCYSPLSEHANPRRKVKSDFLGFLAFIVP